MTKQQIEGKGKRMDKEDMKIRLKAKGMWKREMAEKQHLCRSLLLLSMERSLISVKNLL